MREKSKTELFIIENYFNMTQAEIAKELNIPVVNIQYYARKNNLKKKFIFSDEENEFMKEHYLDMSYKEIADVLGYTERQIRGRINNMGLTKNRKINEYYFDEIDTPEKAYFLGFIYADGWIIRNDTTRNYEFGMQLQSQDKYILEELNNALGGLNIIYHNDPCEHNINGQIAHGGHSDTLRVYSKKIVLGLQKNGIETNKTTKTVFPIINDDLFPDFLRGYIDGDGCYWKYKKYYYMHITSCTDAILKHIQSRLLEHNIETRIYQETEKKYRLMCVNLDSMTKLINYIYYSNNLLCLSRKYERIKSYLIGSAA